MGAYDFNSSAYAETAQDAYNALVEEAEYEEGHNPYNGTISTTTPEGFIMVPFVEGEGSEEWMERVIEDERISKWGPCGCVEAVHVEKNDKGWSLWHFAGWAAS